MGRKLSDSMKKLTPEQERALLRDSVRESSYKRLAAKYDLLPTQIGHYLKRLRTAITTSTETAAF